MRQLVIYHDAIELSFFTVEQTSKKYGVLLALQLIYAP